MTTTTATEANSEINAEASSRQTIDWVLSTSLAMGSEKKRFSTIGVDGNPDEICNKLSLTRIVQDADGEFTKLGITLDQKASSRRKADAVTTLAAACLLEQSGNDLDGVKAAALLLSTNIQPQMELTATMKKSREGGNQGIKSDLQMVRENVGQILVDGIQNRKISRIMGTSLVVVGQSINAAPETILKAARAAAGLEQAQNPEIIGLLSRAKIVNEIAGRLLNDQPKTGLTQESVPFAKFCRAALQVLCQAETMISQEGRLNEIKQFAEIGRIPVDIKSLNELTNIVRNNPGIEGVSFDLYDTLVQWTSAPWEREMHHSERCWKVVQKMGISASKEDVGSMLRAAWQRRWDEFQAHGIEVPLEDTLTDAVQRIVSKFPIQEKDQQVLMGRFQDEWYRGELETAVAMPGAKETLKSLKEKGVKICLTSNASWSSSHVRRVLERFGLLEYFDAISTSNEIGKMKKPNQADFFHYSWRKLGIDPKFMLHIGDNPWDDVEGGSFAGAKTTHFANPSAYNRLEHDEIIKHDHQLYAETAVAMEQETMDREVVEWIRAEMKRKNIPEIEQTRVEQMAKEIYRRTREIFAPAYIAVSKEILNKLQNGEMDKAIFMARDGLPLAITAKLLRYLDRDKYDHVSADQLNFLHVSRDLLTSVTSPQSDQDTQLRDYYIKYLKQKGLLAPGKRIILSDLLCASGHTHNLLSQILTGQDVTGIYLENHQINRPDISGFLEKATGQDRPIITTDTMLLHFESLLNGPHESVREYEVIQTDRGEEIRPVVKRKNPSEKVLIRGLSKESVLFMNNAAVKGLVDGTRLHHRRELVGLPPAANQVTAQRFIDFIVNSPHDDIRLSIPWDDHGEWFLLSQNPLEKI